MTDIPFWLEIDHAAIRHNLHFFRSLIPQQTRLFSVIKSNAYGHGLLAVAKTIDQHPNTAGAIVNSIDEGILLRTNHFQKRIIVAGAYRNKSLLQAAQENNLELEIVNEQNIQELEWLSADLPPLKIFIKVNTGLNRLGFSKKHFVDAFNKIQHWKSIKMLGFFSHFANSEDPQSLQTLQQIATFKELANNFPNYEKHIAASAGTVLIPEAHFDLVRIGIGTYGLWPAEEVAILWRQSHSKTISDPLQPALSFRTRIVHINSVGAGELVGYGGTYMTTRDSRLAVLPCGYYEGLPRSLSNKANVLVCGKKAPIVGRIAMNMTIIDITDIPEANQESIVTIIGSDGDQYISAAEQALHADTIDYELLTRLPEFIHREHLNTT